MDEKIFAKGIIFEIVQLPQPDGRVFEVARRAPGVRMIVADRHKRQIMLTREHRREINDWDFRLPGGKVFDTLDELEAFRRTGQDMLGAATEKAKSETAEEAGIQIDDLKLFKKSTLGTTVEWDLYVFEATKWKPHTQGQDLGAGEHVDVGWYSFAEAEKMILAGQMQEERVALILLQWLKSN